jgi:hypothetical protein
MCSDVLQNRPEWDITKEIAMNTMVKLFAMIVVMAISFNYTEASASDRSAQMMRERNVPPTVLADRIEAECMRSGRIDTSCKPSGSNATVADYVSSINANPEGRVLVKDASDLPRFLRNLKPGPFTNQECLAGMKGVELAAYCHNTRAPHAGEVAWWHGDMFVLAGDCLNARVSYQLQTTQVRGDLFKPVVRERTDPFASRRRTMEGQCAFPDDRYFGVMVFEAKAARHDCAARTMLPYGGLLGSRDGGGNGGSYHDPDRFSRTCGAPLRAEWKAGRISLSTTPHQFEVIVDNGTNEEVIFVGTVTGNTITPATEEHSGLIHESGNLLYLSDEYKSGDLVIRYLDPDGLRTPTASGTGERVENIRRGCKVGAFYAIDADGSARRDVASRD